MATKKEDTKQTIYVITAKNNPSACGRGVAGLAFADGQARCTDLSEWLKTWLLEHDYEVTEE